MTTLENKLEHSKYKFDLSKILVYWKLNKKIAKNPMFTTFSQYFHNFFHINFPLNFKWQVVTVARK